MLGFALLTPTYASWKVVFALAAPSFRASKHAGPSLPWHGRDVFDISAFIIMKTAASLAGLRVVIISVARFAGIDYTNPSGSAAHAFIPAVPLVIFISDFAASLAGAAVLPCMMVLAATLANTSIQFVAKQAFKF
jgi:hypothetical protein